MIAGPPAQPRELLLGNEAIARGALEAGVSFCSGYPGNPSSEIVDTLLRDPQGRPVHVEWSVNEIVAAEAAAGAAFAHLRALTTMKQNGMNVCADFLSTVALTGLGGGALLVVVCDDPGPLTSSNEEDSRLFAELLDLPLLEPATPQEAKELTRFGLELSETWDVPVILRSVTRLSHCRAGVTLEPLPESAPAPVFAPTRPLQGQPFLVAGYRRELKQKLRAMREALDGLRVDGRPRLGRYLGPEEADLVVIASGFARLYAEEAVAALGLEDRVGVLGLGSLWPFPDGAVLDALRRTRRVLVLEQIEPFAERHIKLVHSDHAAELGALDIRGKMSGDVPETGELTFEHAVAAVERFADAPPGAPAKSNLPSPQSPKPVAIVPADSDRQAREAVLATLPPREIAFCRGCPHRASFWAIRAALALDGRDGIVLGDIGCYGLAGGLTGFYQLQTLHCMGAGVGTAAGLGLLRSFGFDRPVLAVAGDSTFYHSCIPGVINARVQGSDMVLVVLDNSTTAMTGFQPHAGSPCDAGNARDLAGRGAACSTLPVEDVMRGLGLDPVVVDPVGDVQGAIATVYDGLQRPGLSALVFRRACAEWERRGRAVGAPPYRVTPELCRGAACGCARFCATVLGCPGNVWDVRAESAAVDPDFCNGCGLCATLCPAGAIAPDTDVPGASIERGGEGHEAETRT